MFVDCIIFEFWIVFYLVGILGFFKVVIVCSYFCNWLVSVVDKIVGVFDGCVYYIYVY